MPPIRRKKRPKSVLASKRTRQTIGPETRVQIMLVEYIKLKYPVQAQFIIKIDNEGRRSALGHTIAIQAGLHCGASDVLLAYPLKGWHGLWIELKREKWKLTESQREHFERQSNFIRKMQSVGYAAYFAIGFDEAKKIVDGYLG